MTPAEIQEHIAAERRRLVRRRVAYRMDLSNARGEHVGCLLDLSFGGMRVRCQPGMDLLGLEKLRIEFPRWIDLGDGVDLKGRFVWSKPVSGGRSEGGFAFGTLSRKTINLIDQLIDRIESAVAEDREAV